MVLSRASLFGWRRAEPAQRPPARAHHELTDPPLGVERTGSGLWGETLVVVVVTRQHQLRAVFLERAPEGVDREAAAVLVP